MKKSVMIAGAFGALTLAASPAQAQVISFATLPPGAVNYVQANVMARIGQKQGGLRIRVTPMRGTPLQIAALQHGRAEFALVLAHEALAARHGTTTFKGKQAPKIRIAYRLMPLFVGIMVRKDSDIRTLADLKGKRYPSGWRAFPLGVEMTNAMLATEGLSIKDLDGVPASNLIGAADDFKAGRTDGTLFAVAAPKVREINSAFPVRFLSMKNTPEAVAAMRKRHKTFYIVKLTPKPFLPGIVGPTNIMTDDLLVLTATHAKDDTVYRMVKAMYENKPELRKGHPSFGLMAPPLLGKKFEGLEYHPGAIKFFKEKGIWKE